MGRGEMHLVMSKQPEMPTIDFHSFPCLCSFFSIPKMRHLLINVFASMISLKCMLMFIQDQYYNFNFHLKF